VRSCATTTVWRSPVEMRDSPSTGDAGPSQLSAALAQVARRVDSASAQRSILTSTMLEAGVEVAYAEIVDPSTLVPSRDDETGERSGVGGRARRGRSTPR